MQLLILNHDAEYIQRILAPKFPELTIHTAINEEEAVDIIEEADILLAIRISDGLIKKASKLKWIQCMITGVNYITELPSFRKEVLLTSSRGIHGPQVSELVFLHMLALNRNFPMLVRNQDRERQRKLRFPIDLASRIDRKSLYAP